MRRAYLYETAASGTDAGAIPITPPGVITRDVNTLECDTIGITEHPSISGRWLVPGGWYDFEASAPFNGYGTHQTGIRAFDAAGNTLWTEWGESGVNLDGQSSTVPWVNARSEVRFRRCLCVPTYVEVVQYVTSTVPSATTDLGHPTSQSGVEEKYTRLIISDACGC